VRLTADDGYQAVRSYSLAAPAGDGVVSITVERLTDGEVSPYLVDEARPGDLLELRGPVGGYFVWRGGDERPLMLIGGGSGVVPLLAMIRARSPEDLTAVRLLYSARSEPDLIARHELDRRMAEEEGLEVTFTLTRIQPPGWTGHSRRVDRAMLREVAWPPGARPRCFVCGPTGFVESVAAELLEMGYPSEDVRTERFGPAGAGA
jgi:ferredoxin-NADP reductase